MTYKDLNEVYYIKKEIAQLKRELREVENMNFYKGNIISDMPKGGSVDMLNLAHQYAQEKERLQKMLNYNVSRLTSKKIEVERFIGTLDNPIHRIIVRGRCIENKRWQDIGEEVFMDRSTVSRKYKTILADNGINMKERTECR